MEATSQEARNTQKRQGTVINQNEKNKVSSTLLSLRLDAQPTVTY